MTKMNRLFSTFLEPDTPSSGRDRWNDPLTCLAMTHFTLREQDRDGYGYNGATGRLKLFLFFYIQARAPELDCPTSTSTREV